MGLLDTRTSGRPANLPQVNKFDPDLVGHVATPACHAKGSNRCCVSDNEHGWAFNQKTHELSNVSSIWTSAKKISSPRCFATIAARPVCVLGASS